MSKFYKSTWRKQYIFKHINHYYWELKYACQRFVKGYDSRDRIDIDCWFSTTLEDILKDWDKDTWGYPQGCTFDGVKINTFEDWQAVILDFYNTVKIYNELVYDTNPIFKGMSDEEFMSYLKNRTLDDIKAEQDIIDRYEAEMHRKFAMLYGRLWI